MKTTDLPKECFSLFGIQYVLTGDLFAGRDFIEDARQLVQAIKRENVYGAKQVWKTKHIPSGGYIHASSIFGVESVYVYVPPRPALPKKKMEIEEKNTWRFVPGIAIKNFDGISISDCYPDTQTQGHMSVCASKDWGGVLRRIVKEDEHIYPREPGEKYIDVIGVLINDTIARQEQLDVYACTNWGETDWSWDSDSETAINLGYDDTDTGWNPGPYGFCNFGGYAYNIVNCALIELDAMQTVYYGWAFGYGSAEMGTFLDECMNNTWPGTSCYSCYAAHEFQWATNADYNDVCSGILHCYQNGTGNTALSMSIITNSGLWDAAIVRGAYETWERTCDPGMCGLICSCSPRVYTFHSLGVLVDIERGGPQIRSRYNRVLYRNTYSLTDVVNRDAGDVSLPDVYNDDTINHSSYSIHGICNDRSQEDTYTSRDLTAFRRGFAGAYIQDDCPVDDFRNLYFVMFTEEYETNDSYKSADQLYASYSWGWSYSTGQWSDGEMDDIPGPWDTISKYQETVLYAYVNGVKIEIDRAVDDIANEVYYDFEVIDSYIFNALGTPVYMYGYVKYRYEYINDEGIYSAEYTRYGYFYGDSDSHYQSELFYPAGIMNTEYPEWYGEMNLHDVHGSQDLDTPLYGWGQCCGFLVNERTKETYELSR